MQEVPLPHLAAVRHGDGELQTTLPLLTHYHPLTHKHEEIILHGRTSPAIGSQAIPAHLGDGLQTSGSDGQTG